MRGDSQSSFINSDAANLNVASTSAGIFKQNSNNLKVVKESSGSLSVKLRPKSKRTVPTRESKFEVRTASQPVPQEAQTI